jgi:hypothetical protein
MATPKVELVVLPLVGLSQPFAMAAMSPAVVSQHLKSTGITSL